MIKKSCPYCESVQDVQEVKQQENLKYKGKNVSYEAIHYECCNCHELFDSPEMMDANLLAVKEAFDLQYNFLPPKEIIAIREKYNASQKAFGLILGMGELTINSYEQEKSIPSPSNKLLIALADNPLIFFEMYEQNKSKIGAIQRERIESSECFVNCKRWGGLEELYNRLSCAERKTIENKTYLVGDSVAQIVSDMVRAEMNKPNFEIYQDAHEINPGTISMSDNKLFSMGVA